MRRFAPRSLLLGLVLLGSIVAWPILAALGSAAPALGPDTGAAPIGATTRVAPYFEELPAFDHSTGRRLAPGEPPTLDAPPVATTSCTSNGAGHAQPGSTVKTAHPASGRIALTFDLDEGRIDALPVILETLREFEVRATFFVTGSWAKTNPDWIRRLLAEGHELGNHSFNHPNFTKLSAAAMAREVEATEAAVAGAAGVTTRPYFRPPYGAFNHVTLNILADQGFANVVWDVDPQDWRGTSSATMVAQVVTNATPGQIVLFHAYLWNTAQALPAVLAGLKAKGIQPASLGETLRASRSAP